MKHILILKISNEVTRAENENHLLDKRNAGNSRVTPQFWIWMHNKSAREGYEAAKLMTNGYWISKATISTMNKGLINEKIGQFF